MDFLNNLIIFPGLVNGEIEHPSLTKKTKGRPRKNLLGSNGTTMENKKRKTAGDKTGEKEAVNVRSDVF